MSMLPIVERWDCHRCGICCRGTVVFLNPEDVKRLEAQRWETVESMRGVKTTTKVRGISALAKRPDGSCVFLTESGSCRIHDDHGPTAKPTICRLFPLVSVPGRNGKMTVTVRRSCPSAAKDQGRPLAEHLSELSKDRSLQDAWDTKDRRHTPPAVERRRKRDWHDFHLVSELLMRLTNDVQYPPVRRLVHGIAACRMLLSDVVRHIDGAAYREFVEIVETDVTDYAAPFFRDRLPPSSAASFVFRQLATHFLRVHPQSPPSQRLRTRIGWLWLAFRFARGWGNIPSFANRTFKATVDELDAPLGPLPLDVARPLYRYFEMQTASKYYATLGHQVPLLESYLGLALMFPIALFLLRLLARDDRGEPRTPTSADVVDLVVMLDRGYDAHILSRVANMLNESEQLPRLIAWYAR